jgi:shikimate kinase
MAAGGSGWGSGFDRLIGARSDRRVIPVATCSFNASQHAPTDQDGGAAVSGDADTGAAAIPRPDRSVVLVGLMGAGKTSVGKRLARALGLPFVDADNEIETAAGMTIKDIFELYGEPAFRDLERRVVARLLDDSPRILALGGGAFIDPATRALVRARGLSVWLRVGLDVLVERTARRTHRPLLNRSDPRAVLERLIEQRYPIYAEAELTVDTERGDVEDVVQHIIDRIAAGRGGEDA